jgi:hypothetical protein
MPYKLLSAQRPRSGPSYDRQKHPSEPAGTVFVAESFYDKAGQGTWLLSTQRSGNPSYPKKWYFYEWCVVAGSEDGTAPEEEGVSNLEDALTTVFRIIKALWEAA